MTTPTPNVEWQVPEHPTITFRAAKSNPWWLTHPDTGEQFLAEPLVMITATSDSGYAAMPVPEDVWAVADVAAIQNQLADWIAGHGRATGKRKPPTPEV